MNRVLVVSSHFPPRQAAGVYRTLRFVRYLPNFNWKVHVLTIDAQSYEPGVQIDSRLLDMVPDDVTVHTTKAIYPMQWLDRARRMFRRRESTNENLPMYAPSFRSRNGTEGDEISTRTSKKASATQFQRIKDALTIPLMTPDRTIGWIPFAGRRGKRVIRKHGVDVIYSSGPPWSNHLVAKRLKQSTDLPWVADFRDPWVGNDYRSQRRGNTWAGRRHRQLEQAVVQSADAVIMNTIRARDEMIGRHADVPPEKFSVITNGFDPLDWESENSTEAVGDEAMVSPNEKRKMIIAHAGSFYGKRSVEEFMVSLRNVCRTGHIPKGEIEVQLLGAQRGGRSVERELVQRLDLEEIVRVLPPIPHDECLQKMRAADLLLLIQSDAPLCIPGKVFEYIATGRPMLTLAADGATADLIRNAKLGPCIDPSDHQALESELVHLFQCFKTGKKESNSQRDLRLQFDGRRLTRKLSETLKHVTAAQN